jgi:hypothetical protein
MTHGDMLLMVGQAMVAIVPNNSLVARPRKDFIMLT